MNEYELGYSAAEKDYANLLTVKNEKLAMFEKIPELLTCVANWMDRVEEWALIDPNPEDAEDWDDCIAQCRKFAIMLEKK